MTDKKYLRMLSKQYPTYEKAATEIINLEAILSLPKGTEHFLTDVHGEYEQFEHVLKNGSGTVKRKIDMVLKDTKDIEYKKRLTTLIYYPKEKLELIKAEGINTNEWYKETIMDLVDVLKCVTSKYTRSKVRKAIPDEYRYVIEELITEKEEIDDKALYYQSIIDTIVRVEEADNIIIAISELIQRMVVDHLHIVGDIYDRGPGPHKIMDTLMNYHSVDLVWGNHDVVWMGAASGHPACIANVIRMSARYGNLSIIEDGYGINLLPLATYAMETYKYSDCSKFRLKETSSGEFLNASEIESKMYEAITVIQFKLEGEVIKRNPDFEMDGQLLLDKIDYKNKTVRIGDMEYALNHCDFPTVNPEDPYILTPEEDMIVKQLVKAFMNSEKLRKHIKFLYKKGALYRVYNGNLIFHGCVLLNEDGSFAHSKICNTDTYGKSMYELLDKYARKGFYAPIGSKDREKGGDILWYLWCGPHSPLYGRSKMTTFERLFIEDKETHKEEKDPYYRFIEDDEKTAEAILKEFGATAKYSKIINGHVPIEIKNGQTPIKAGGKVLMIDGGFSKAYHDKTGMAGYTLAIDSHGSWLVQHEKFESKAKAIALETDIVSDTLTVETFEKRMYVRDTDNGKRLLDEVEELDELLTAYKDGTLAD
ncbi:MAG: fructose-1,6-bisphosphatase [Lachnospiraceae bacterium]|nr:fructose-1,6-bisphosphatase [Lachnospiraceae bacterium]